jgi:hypothetical protein
MKKMTLRSMLFGLAIFGASTVSAQDAKDFTIDEITVAPGATVDVEVKCPASDEYTYRSFNFDLYAKDAEFTIDANSFEFPVANGHTGKCSAKAQTKGDYNGMTRYRVQLGGANEDFLDGDVMCTFKLTAGEAEGDFELIMDGCALGQVKDDVVYKYAMPKTTFTVKVTKDTGIESVSVENNAPVYNLAGMLMNGNLQKGIYVQNGKKYIVK